MRRWKSSETHFGKVLRQLEPCFEGKPPLNVCGETAVRPAAEANPYLQLAKSCSLDRSELLITCPLAAAKQKCFLHSHDLHHGAPTVSVRRFRVGD